MATSYEFAALLGGSQEVDDGLRVRLRLARSSDAWAIGRLLTEAAADEAHELTRLVRFDPRRDCVLCATALIDGRETLVGVGSIQVTPGGACPELLVVDPSWGEGVRELLTAALLARARAAAA